MGGLFADGEAGTEGANSGNAVPGESGSAGPAEASPTTSAPKTTTRQTPKGRKRVREQMTVAATVERGNTIVWRRDGKDVPVAPPPWSAESATSLAALNAHIAAHNSFVSAMAAAEAAEAVKAAVCDFSAPQAKRTKRASAARGSAGTRRAMAVFSPRCAANVGSSPTSATSTAAVVASTAAGAAPAAGTERSGAPSAGTPAMATAAIDAADVDDAAEDEEKAGTSSDEETGSGEEEVVAPPTPRKRTRRPREGKQTNEMDEASFIIASRGGVTKRMHCDVLSPPTNDSAYLPGHMHHDYFQEIVTIVAKVSPEKANQLLLKIYVVREATAREKATTTTLKAWLRKTPNNVHFNLRKAIFASWAEGAGYKKGREQAGKFFEGRGFIKGRMGRCGLVAAFLAAVAQCSGDPEAYNFPD